MDLSEQFDQKLITFLLLINEKINRQFEDTYRGAMTTSQFYAVAMLNNCGHMPMSALARRMGIQKQQATKVVNQLVKMGFLQRSDDVLDRRITNVVLTAKAKEYMNLYMFENIKQISKGFTALDEQEFEQLEAAIDTINRILPRIGVGKGNKSTTATDK